MVKASAREAMAAGVGAVTWVPTERGWEPGSSVSIEACIIVSYFL